MDDELYPSHYSVYMSPFVASCQMTKKLVMVTSHWSNQMTDTSESLCDALKKSHFIIVPMLTVTLMTICSVLVRPYRLPVLKGKGYVDSFKSFTKDTAKM